MSNNEEITTFFENLLNTIMIELSIDNTSYTNSTLNKVIYLYNYLYQIEEMRNFSFFYDLVCYSHNVKSRYITDENNSSYSIQTYTGILPEFNIHNIVNFIHFYLIPTIFVNYFSQHMDKFYELKTNIENL
jgi:hypothetical protein